MELRHIYSIATAMSKAFESDDMVGSDVGDIEINVSVSPSTLYGIDREFYRQTHNDSIEGFVHKDKIEAVIDNIHFVINEKEMSSK